LLRGREFGHVVRTDDVGSGIWGDTGVSAPDRRGVGNDETPEQCRGLPMAWWRTVTTGTLAAGSRWATWPGVATIT